RSPGVGAPLNPVESPDGGFPMLGVMSHSEPLITENVKPFSPYPPVKGCRSEFWNVTIAASLRLAMAQKRTSSISTLLFFPRIVFLSASEVVSRAGAKKKPRSKSLFQPQRVRWDQELTTRLLLATQDLELLGYQHQGEV